MYVSVYAMFLARTYYPHVHSFIIITSCWRYSVTGYLAVHVRMDLLDLQSTDCNNTVLSHINLIITLLLPSGPLFPHQNQIVQVQLKSFGSILFLGVLTILDVRQHRLPWHDMIVRVWLLSRLLENKIRPRTAKIPANLCFYCLNFICLPFLFPLCTNDTTS